MNGRNDSLLVLIRSSWRNSPTAVKRLSVAMWTVGATLGTLGISGDILQLWSSYPFVTNLLSSMCGALIGIPVALFVVQQLSMTQTAALADSRNLATVKALTMQLRANVEQVVPGTFADFGFLSDAARKPKQAGAVLADIRRELGRSGELSAATRERLSQVITEHRETCHNLFTLDQRTLEVRAVWLMLKPSLLALPPEMTPPDSPSMAAAIDYEFGQVLSTSRLSYRDIDDLWSNWDDEEQSPGRLTLDDMGIARRREMLQALHVQMDALNSMYATLDGVTARINAFLLQVKFD
ncbi:hypothetical protein [Micromonospora sp. NPDC049891]|uniref:hypothetical protein n=1 Tax=Micromonospora sp. NPDC049891 TaxID=3155655 RepID=UPI0033E1FEF6